MYDREKLSEVVDLWAVHIGRDIARLLDKIKQLDAGIRYETQPRKVRPSANSRDSGQGEG